LNERVEEPSTCNWSRSRGKTIPTEIRIVIILLRNAPIFPSPDILSTSYHPDSPGEARYNAPGHVALGAF
jgi:hypothetical protein